MNGTAEKRQRECIGVVLSQKTARTAVVKISRRVNHPKYQRSVPKVTRLHVHDPNGVCRVGERVRIAETRPVSKTKAWVVVSSVSTVEPRVSVEPERRGI